MRKMIVVATLLLAGCPLDDSRIASCGRACGDGRMDRYQHVQYDTPPEATRQGEVVRVDEQCWCGSGVDGGADGGDVKPPWKRGIYR